MVKFQLNGAGIIDLERLGKVTAEANSLTDNRFAVINGLLFDMMTCENVLDDTADAGFSVTVGVYVADEVFNASFSAELAHSYADNANFIVAFEYFVSKEASADNELCIDAEKNGDALFMHLIGHALRDCVNTKERLHNFAKGLDLNHIQTVGSAL